RPQLVLTDDRDTLRCQEGRTEDHACTEAFVLLALEAAVVVGNAVEVEVGDQPVEADGNLCGPTEVVVVDRAVEREDLAGEILTRHDLRLGDRRDPYSQVVELDHLHVAAE